MGSQRYCDLCAMFKQNPDGTPAVHRYGLSRQIRENSIRRYKTVRGFGGLDICDECWRKKAAPKQRPELVGKTGHRRESSDGQTLR